MGQCYAGAYGLSCWPPPLPLEKQPCPIRGPPASRGPAASPAAPGAWPGGPARGAILKTWMSLHEIPGRLIKSRARNTGKLYRIEVSPVCIGPIPSKLGDLWGSCWRPTESSAGFQLWSCGTQSPSSSSQGEKTATPSGPRTVALWFVLIP